MIEHMILPDHVLCYAPRVLEIFMTFLLKILAFFPSEMAEMSNCELSFPKKEANYDTRRCMK